MELIRAQQYAETMDRTVVPWMEARRESGYFERVSGQKIYWQHFRADEERGVLVLVHGFTEEVTKFTEAAWYFVRSGLSVWQIQQRGHGLSYRGNTNPSRVHITDFNDLILDLHYFMHEVVQPAESAKPGESAGPAESAKPGEPATSAGSTASVGLPCYLYGHSMGGGVSALYLERYPDDFQKAVLSSPMMELNSGGVPVFLAAALARILIAAGKGEEYFPGGGDYTGKSDFENSCTNCRERYDWWFAIEKSRKECQTSGPSVCTSYQFLKLTQELRKKKNTERVRAQVLLVQAGQDTMVLPGGQDRFLEQIGAHGTKLRIESARHEIYRGTDEEMAQYWPAVLKFLA